MVWSIIESSTKKVLLYFCMIGIYWKDMDCCNRISISVRMLY